MKIIALDFDGVIVDSIEEQYVLAVQAFENIGVTKERTKKFRDEFRFLRSFVRIAEDFYAFFRIIEENGKIRFDEKEISNLRDKVLEKEKEKASNYADLYFENKKKLLKKGFKPILKLLKPNKNFISMMKKLSKNYTMFIATAGDKKLTSKTMKYFGVEIPENKIVSKEDNPNKTEQMKIISEISGTGFKDIIFIEDNFENLMEASKLGIKPVLVEWGYNTPNQRKEAKKLGIPVLTKGNFEEQLTKIIGD